MLCPDCEDGNGLGGCGWYKQDHRQELGRLVQSQPQAWLGEAPTVGPPTPTPNPAGWPLLQHLTGQWVWSLVPWHTVPTDVKMDSTGPSDFNHQLPMCGLGWVHLIGQA